VKIYVKYADMIKDSQSAKCASPASGRQGQVVQAVACINCINKSERADSDWIRAGWQELLTNLTMHLRDFEGLMTRKPL
jgi:hypothetical protein